MTVPELPAPPVPLECDLRRYSWIPLPVALVRDSTWWLTASDAAQAAQLRLMVAAWHQIPAASLPDDDRLLAKLGRISSKVIRCLTEIKQEWTLCTDGRLYHPELAEIALKSWEKMQSQAARTAAARAAIAQKRTSVTDTVTGSIREEKIREEKKREESLSFLNVFSHASDGHGADAPREEREKTKKSERLPHDWQPSPADKKLAESLRLDFGKAFSAFRDYYAAETGPKAHRADWGAAFRSWCRKAKQIGASGDDSPRMTSF